MIVGYPNAAVENHIDFGVHRDQEGCYPCSLGQLLSIYCCQLPDCHLFHKITREQCESGVFVEGQHDNNVLCQPWHPCCVQRL